MAKRTNGAAYRELTGRYQFHLALQGIYRTVRKHKQKSHFYAAHDFSREKLSPDELAETMGVPRSARRALKEVIREADEIDMPGMKNFVAGKRLGEFLLDQKPVREFPEENVSGEHIVKLLEQLDTVQNRAERLHFKSLGVIMALQERVCVEFLAGRSAPVPATVTRVKPESKPSG